MQIRDLISCFDRVYVVNLPERLDRKQETIAEFKRIGLNVPNERVRFFEATRPDNADEFPSIGSLGNFISQTRVLRECIELGLDRVAICEDDLKFNAVSPEAMKRIVEDIKTEDWNIASLAYLKPDQQLSEPPGLVKWDGSTRGCHFYAVRGEAIKSFHDYLVACRQRPAGHPEGGAMFFDGAFNFRVRIKLTNTLRNKPRKIFTSPQIVATTEGQSIDLDDNFFSQSVFHKISGEKTNHIIFVFSFCFRNRHYTFHDRLMKRVQILFILIDRKTPYLNLNHPNILSVLTWELSNDFE